MAATPDAVLAPAHELCEQNGTRIAEILFEAIQDIALPIRLSSTLVFAGDCVPPARRIRAEVTRAAEIPAVAHALATALGRNGIAFGAEHDPQVPPNEVWITLVHERGAVMNIP